MAGKTITCPQNQKVWEPVPLRMNKTRRTPRARNGDRRELQNYKRNNTKCSCNDWKCTTSTEGKSEWYVILGLMTCSCNSWQRHNLHSVCDASRALVSVWQFSSADKIIIHLCTYSQVSVYNYCLFHSQLTSEQFTKLLFQFCCLFKCLDCLIVWSCTIVPLPTSIRSTVYKIIARAKTLSNQLVRCLSGKVLKVTI